MKKISIMLLAALAFGFTACEDESTAIPQSNPQEPIMSAEGIVVAPVDSVPAFDLKALADAEADAAVLNVVEAQNLPAVGDLTFVMQLSKTEDFAAVQEVATAVVNNQVCVDPADWQAAHLKVLGKNPKTQDAYVRFAAYIVNGSSSVRIGNPNLYYAAHKVSVTPFPAAVTIEDSYSLVINGGETIAMNHTGDVYDNPVFTAKVDVTEAQEWAVKGAELTYAPVADETSAEFGTLVAGEGWGVMPVGTWLLTVNMETLTYSFSSAVENLWTPGDANGWNHGGSQMLFTNNYTEYMGFANLSVSGFKFTSAADWSHTNYGDAGEEGKLSTDGGAGNLTVPESGLYWCKVDIAALTWSATKIETIGVIGGFNGWSESLPLTSEDGLFWTGTITLNEGDEYKFRCNNDWAINLGGADEYNLVPDGANLKAPATGTFTITLDLSVVPYACYLE
ncbi:MAG: hypothetical protein II990_08485 [Muribaculaceae bacterium]|nr:hypothetical protein [Muribaculaceae bacterium]